LIVSANVSYQNAAKDVKYLTGIDVSSKTQQRLVHQQAFKLPIQDKEIQELSVDGGKIRLRTPLGEPCIWRDYKGIRLHEQVTEAFMPTPRQQKQQQDLGIRLEQLKSLFTLTLLCHSRQRKSGKRSEREYWE